MVIVDVTIESMVTAAHDRLAPYERTGSARNLRVWQRTSDSISYALKDAAISKAQLGACLLRNWKTAGGKRFYTWPSERMKARGKDDIKFDLQQDFLDYMDDNLEQGSAGWFLDALYRAWLSYRDGSGDTLEPELLAIVAQTSIDIAPYERSNAELTFYLSVATRTRVEAALASLKLDFSMLAVEMLAESAKKKFPAAVESAMTAIAVDTSTSIKVRLNSELSRRLTLAIESKPYSVSQMLDYMMNNWAEVAEARIQAGEGQGTGGGGGSIVVPGGTFDVPSDSDIESLFDDWGN